MIINDIYSFNRNVYLKYIINTVPILRGICDIIERDGNQDDIFAFLVERNIPADEVTLINIAKDLLNNPPLIGYLTISNALQWRLQYSRIVNLSEEVNGITSIIKYESES